MTDEELRALAEAATRGPWEEGRRVFHDGHSVQRLGPIEACWCNDETAELDFTRGQADIDYIKAVSPDVVLALLDRLRDKSPGECQESAGRTLGEAL